MTPQRPRVLCLDDDLSVARMVADVVEFNNCEPVVETDAMRAVTQHIQANYAVAIVDLLMPRMSGIDVLTAFMQGSPKTRRVLLTAAPHEPEVAEAKAAGVVQLLIVKPPTLSDLRLAVAWL